MLKLVSLASVNSDVCILVSNDSSTYEKKILAGIGSEFSISSSTNQDSFESLKLFLKDHPTWLFGHFSYDLKNEIEKLYSGNPDGIEFPQMNFFCPEYLIRLQNDTTTILSNKKNTGDLFSEIQDLNSGDFPLLTIRARTSHEDYLSKVNQLITHIHRGDIYEINYCIEFFAENVLINPAQLFLKLNEISDAPFSALYRNGDHWLMCASPERFLQKKGNHIQSQPIKGTRPRGKNPEEDEALKKELQNDPKERSENVMIVDLVRNDLSRSAKKGSVKVDELFGIHSFKNVHQLISTVSAELNPEIHPVDAIKNAFPMGSMTGAPKVSAMELAEKFENTKRGLYSGAVGYFSPEMDFDFNVVIRSIQYNSKTRYLSFMVGSAITANSDPEKEYQECLVKARTLFQALGLKPLD